jgi:dinuclear metal center YbgI/SA1388 family protein
MTTVADLIDELEDIAPPELADADDRIGLQVGDPSADVQRVCVTVDVSVGVVDLAIERGADLLVAHHPLIYAPLTSVAEIDPVRQRLVKLIRANVALFVMHTNYDTVPGGVNDALAAKLGVLDGQPLTTRKTDPLVKIAVFVPESAAEQVRNAMADAGAGMIGQYTHCSFRTTGIGSFVPLPAAQPYVGSAGRLEEVEECKLEMACVASWATDVVAAMIEAHPYDEVAYDVYELANEPIRYGYGRVGTLEDTISLREFVERTKLALGLEYAKVSGDLDKPIKRVAFCAGGASLHYREAAQAGADVYVTGDTKHQDFLDASALGLAMIDAGHFETEKPGMVVLTERLKKTFAGSGLEIEYIE